jgi:hypothetical protein
MSEEELATRNASQVATLRAKYADNEVYGLPGDRRRNRHDQKELVEILNNAESVRWCLAGIPALNFWGVPKIALVCFEL